MTALGSLESADWLTLTNGEQIEWMGRPSLFTIAPRLLIAVLVGVGGVMLVSLLASVATVNIPTAIQLSPLLIGLAMGVIVLLRWYRVQYVITTNEVYIKRGFVSLDIAQIRLSRIQNTTLNQSMIQRLLGYGDVVAYTAGTDLMNIEFKHVPDPAAVNRTLSTLLSESSNNPVQL